MRLLSCVLFVLTTSIVVVADDFKPETGFKLLFNGKNLDGWQNKMGKKDVKPELLEGKTEAFGGRFKVKDGELVLDPAVKGDKYIETTEQFTDPVTIRFDFKPGDKCNNDLFLLGTKFDITKEGVKNAKFDEWNQFEIAVKDGKAEFKCNGQSIKTIPTKGTGLKLTDQSFVALGTAKLPEPVLRKLKSLKDKQFNAQEDFVRELTGVLEKDETKQYQNLILKHAATKGEKSTFCFRAEFGNIVYRNVRVSDGK